MPCRAMVIHALNPIMATHTYVHRRELGLPLQAVQEANFYKVHRPTP